MCLPYLVLFIPTGMILLHIKELSLTFFCGSSHNKFFQVFLSDNILIWLYCLVGELCLGTYRILCCFFFFHCFKDLFSPSSSSHTYFEKIAAVLIFTLGINRPLLLPLMCRCVIFFIFILLGFAKCIEFEVCNLSQDLHILSLYFLK